MSGESFPRTLIVTEAPFCLDNGFGVTLTTFFDGWPSGRLRLFYSQSCHVPVSSLCPDMIHADSIGPRGRRYGLELLLGLRPAWRGLYSHRWLRRNLGGWKFDVVYSLVFSVETLCFAAWIARLHKKPLMVHVADGVFEGSASSKSNRVAACLSQASARVAISQEMASELENQFRFRFDVLHNGASLRFFEPLSDFRGKGVGEPYMVRYLGSILPGHHFSAIEDIAEAVEVLNERGVPARLELYGGEWTREHALSIVKERKYSSYHGSVADDRGRQLLQTADLLVIPVSFSPERQREIRFSFPTKLPEYLASGTPVLVYGPRGAAPVEFCLRERAGHVVAERGTGKIVEFINSHISDIGLFEKQAAKDRDFVRCNFSAETARLRFRSLLSDAVAQTG